MIWKALPEVAWLVGIVALLWMFTGKARKGRSANVRSDGRIDFTPNETAYIAWPLVVGIVAWLAIRNVIHNPRFVELWITASFAYLAFEFLTMFPATIVASSDGLEQVFWFWKNRRISWKNIVEINTGKKERTITIVAADGTKIVHSNRLADRQRLLREIKIHCCQNLPTDFPSE